MKTMKFYVIALCLLSIAVVSACNKKKDDPAPATPFAYSTDKLQNRWEVANNSRTTGTAGSTLIAVEFVQNAYILYFPDDSIATGTYSTSGTDVIVLNGFGKLKVNTLTETNFGFELEVDGTKEVFTSAKADQAIPDSDNTTKLCRTWKLVEYTFLGTTEKPENSEVVFNKYGTYLTTDTEGGVTDVGSNTWMWSNTDEDEFCYGSWDGGNITDCNGLGSVTIVFSDNDTKATLVETDATFGDTVYKLELK